MFDHHSTAERLRNLVLMVVILAVAFGAVGGVAGIVLDTLDQAGASMSG